MQKHEPNPLQALQGIDPHDLLSAEDAARACRTSVDWVMIRVHEDILQATYRDGQCYLSSATVWRAQQIQQIERQFDADPQLAALVTDLLEEVKSLRDALKFKTRDA